MKRRLFNLLAAVSLVMCLGTVALWICGSGHEYQAWWLHRSLSIGIISNGGKLAVCCSARVFQAPCTLVLALLSVLPFVHLTGSIASAIAYRRRERRFRLRECPNCGYDLRATPETIPQKAGTEQ